MIQTGRMKKTLLVTPPFVQLNCPYPATAYLTGYLRRQGYEVTQIDLGIELINRLFSTEGLTKIFGVYTGCDDPNIQRIHNLRQAYIDTIDTVMRFIRGEDPTLANLICTSDFLPQAGRFDSINDLSAYFGSLGTQDCAKFLSTFMLQDLSDYIRATITPHFELVRYGESLAASVPEFTILEAELSQPVNLIETEMLTLFEHHITTEKPDLVGFTIPFPGNLLAALRCAQHIKRQHPDIRTVAGGGYPSTELRSMSDQEIFKYFDYVSLDDGELALERILDGGPLIRTYTADGYHDRNETLSHHDQGCPDFTGLPHHLYLSLTELTNPMHRLWSDGRWNKMMIAHGCYWAKCAFCDTSLDYICRHDAVPAATIVDWMETIIAQTGSRGFHFVDEAAPPRLLKEIALEILRRKLQVNWWTNIRFEKSFTGDLCHLLAASGCIAVSGGLEVASDRILRLINKGVTIEQAALAMRNFSRAGIMIHAYLMYGFPSETLQETIDSLEIVRQLFHAEVLNSAFWHRYAMTVHSPSGQHPETFGVRRKHLQANPFANNEVWFAEDRGYNINQTGESLHNALAAYMTGEGLNRPVHKWFVGKAPQTTIEPTLIEEQMIHPDACRIYDANARLVWIGSTVERSPEGIRAIGRADEKTLKLSVADADFIIRIIESVKDLNSTFTFADIQTIYAEHSTEPFAYLYHSKQWDRLREFGLLQI